MTGALTRSIVLSIVAASVLAACGPLRAGGLIVDAAGEMAAADNAQAPKIAPYEYWAADSYLHKAREDHSYAKFETAEIFARKARDCARLARARAEAKTRREIGASEGAIPKGVHCRAGLHSRSARGAKDPRGVPAGAEPEDPKPVPEFAPAPAPETEPPLPAGDAGGSR